MRKTSIAHLSALDASPHEMIDLAAKCGFDFVGLRLLPVTPQEAPSPLIANRALRRDLVVHAAEEGIGVLDVELFKLTPETEISVVEPALAAASELGARHALTQIHDLDAMRAVDRFSELCELAASYNLTCDVEFLSWTEMRDVAAVRRLLRSAGKSNAGICLDTLHFWRSGCELGEIERLPSKWIHFVQVADALGPREVTPEEMVRVAREDRLAPGDGVIDLFGILARLPYDVPISLEVPNRALAQQVSHQARLRAARSKLNHVLEAIEAGAT